MLLIACEPEPVEPRRPTPKGQDTLVPNDTVPKIDSAFFTHNIPATDVQLESRTWQFMGYGNTDSTNLDLPVDATQHTLILKDFDLSGTTPSGNFTAKYKLYYDKRIRIDSLSGNGLSETPYINALKAVSTARKYEVQNEALKIFYTDKQYLLFVEKSEQYPSNLTSQLVYMYDFELKAGRRLVINSQSELDKYLNAPNEDIPYAGLWPYTECMYPDYNLFDLQKQPIDFSKYSIVIGSILLNAPAMHTVQNFTQVGSNTFLYNVKLFQKYEGHCKYYYGVVVNKIPSTATIIYNIELIKESDWHW